MEVGEDVWKPKHSAEKLAREAPPLGSVRPSLPGPGVSTRWPSALHAGSGSLGMATVSCWVARLVSLQPSSVKQLAALGLSELTRFPYKEVKVLAQVPSCEGAAGGSMLRAGRPGLVWAGDRQGGQAQPAQVFSCWGLGSCLSSAPYWLGLGARLAVSFVTGTHNFSTGLSTFNLESQTGDSCLVL